MSKPFAWRPLSERIGVEVDLDLSRKLAVGEQQLLKEPVHRHGSIVARRQKLAREEHCGIISCCSTPGGPVDLSGVGARKLHRVISVAKGFLETHPQFLAEIRS